MSSIDLSVGQFERIIRGFIQICVILSLRICFDFRVFMEFENIIYAVDEYGICYPIQKSLIPFLIKEQKDVSQSIMIISEHIDNSTQNPSDYLFSTQPFSIFDFSETNRPCLHDDILTPILSPPLQSSGQIATQYKNLTLIQTNNEINLKVKSKKKKIKRLHLPLNRFDRLKKQLKIYLKKKKKTQQQHQPTVSNISISSSSSSTLIDHSNLIDLPLSPDLSKRKYIYKEISLSNNSNQLNLKIFQCTQQIPSTLASIDQTTANMCNYTTKFISSPDIRIGLSKYYNTKHLHKAID